MINHEEFVRAWQNAEVSTEEIQKMFAVSKARIYQFAAGLRKHGVPLRNRRVGRPKLDYEKLTALANELASSNGKEGAA